MTDAIRVWFIVAYGLGFVFFLLLIFRFRARHQVVEQRAGPLPPPPALVALNWILLVLSPGIVAALNKSARVEEGMLRTKFGGAYDAYAQGKGRLVPRL